VIDNDQPGPSIITERDILHSNGVRQDVEGELVRDHLTAELVSTAADWSLEQAAAEMVRGGLRHVVVRCWTSDGATCAVAR
jgi:hypothetical protein